MLGANNHTTNVEKQPQDPLKNCLHLNDLISW